MGVRFNWDFLGIMASLACAIHCAVLPLFMTSLPLFGVNIVNNLSFEILMIILAAVIGLYSLTHGFKKHHHSKLPITLFVVGIVLLLAKQVLHEWDIYFLIPAVILIVAAHYFNYRLCRSADQCHTDDCKH